MSSRERREHDDDREPSLAGKLFWAVVLSPIPVGLLAAAWDIATTPPSECRRAIKTGSRAWWNSLWTCASDQDLARLGRTPSDGVSPKFALLVLTLLGLVALAVWLRSAAGMARDIHRRLHGPAASDDGEELINDLDRLDELHRRGDLPHGDLVDAKRRRRILGLRHRATGRSG